MFRSVLVSALLLTLLTACEAGDASQPASTLTPIPGATTLIRLDTFTPVHEAFVAGRVPAGLANEVTITRAVARTGGYNDDQLQDAYVDLSIVASAPRRGLFDGGGHAYEWWFVANDSVDVYPLYTSADEAELKIALRYVDGVWSLFADTGDGWEPAVGDFNVGVLEVSAYVRIEDRWPLLKRGRDTYLRAIIRHDEPTPDGFQVGDIYPRDGRWMFVSD